MPDTLAWLGSLALGLFAWGCAIALEMILFCLMARLLLAYHQANFDNPVSQLLVRTTDPLYQPVRRVLRPVFGWDIALLVVAFPLKLAAIYALDKVVQTEQVMEIGSVLGIVLFALCYMAVAILYVYLFALIMVVFSGAMRWFATGEYFLELACDLVWPMISRFRRVLPDIKFLDLSLVVALLTVLYAQLLFVSLASRVLEI